MKVVCETTSAPSICGRGQGGRFVGHGPTLRACPAADALHLRVAFLAHDDQRQSRRFRLAGHVVYAGDERAGGVADLAGAALQAGKRPAADAVRAHHGARAQGNIFRRFGAYHAQRGQFIDHAGLWMTGPNV